MDAQPCGRAQVVGQSAEAVAVCKPAGMPVHVAGQYRKNTVLGVLTAERPDLGQLFPIHSWGKCGHAGQCVCAAGDVDVVQ